MVLIRLITLQGLKDNVCIYAKHVKGIHNKLSDALSRGKMGLFKKLTKNLKYNEQPTEVPQELLPLQKIWL